MHSTERIEFGSSSTTDLYFEISDLESVIALFHFISDLSESDKDKIFQGNFDKEQYNLLRALFFDFNRAGNSSSAASQDTYTSIGPSFPKPPFRVIHSGLVAGIKRNALTALGSDRSSFQSEMKRAHTSGPSSLSNRNESTRYKDKEQPPNAANLLAEKSEGYRMILDRLGFEEVKRFCKAIINSLIDLIDQVEASQDKWLFEIFNKIIKSGLVSLINNCGPVILRNIIHINSETLLKNCKNNIYLLVDALLRTLSQEHQELERQKASSILNDFLAYDFDVVSQVIFDAIRNRLNLLNQNRAFNLEALTVLSEQILNLNPKIFNNFTNDILSIMELLASGEGNYELEHFFYLVDKLVKNKHFELIRLCKHLIYDLVRRLSDVNELYHFLMVILDLPDRELVLYFKAYFQTFYDFLKSSNNLNDLRVDVLFEKIIITRHVKLLSKQYYIDYINSRINNIKSSGDPLYQFLIENIPLIKDKRVLNAFRSVISNFMRFLEFGSDGWMKFINSVLDKNNSILILALQNQIHDYYYMLVENPDQQKIIITKILSSDLRKKIAENYYLAFKEILTAQLAKDFTQDPENVLSDYEKFFSIVNENNNQNFRVAEQILMKLRGQFGLTNFYWFSYCPRSKLIVDCVDEQGPFPLGSINVSTLRSHLCDRRHSNGVLGIRKQQSKPFFYIQLRGGDSRESYRRWYKNTKKMLLSGQNNEKEAVDNRNNSQSQTGLEREVPKFNFYDIPPEYLGEIQLFPGEATTQPDTSSNDQLHTPIVGSPRPHEQRRLSFFEQQQQFATTPRFMPIEERSTTSKQNSQLFTLFLKCLTRITVLDRQSVEDILKTIEAESRLLSFVLKGVIQVQTANYAEAIAFLKMYQEVAMQGAQLPGVTQYEMNIINSIVDEYTEIAEVKQRTFSDFHSF